MPFLQKENDRIFYINKPAKCRRETDTIILIHTNIMDHTIFDSIIPLLNKDFHVVTYDLRGFGLSEQGSKELTLDLYVNDLKFLIKSLRLESVHIAGYGFGGLIALKFSILYQDLVKKLILMTMACFPKESYDFVKFHRRKVSEGYTKIPVDTLIKKVTSLTTDNPEYERLHKMISRVPISLYKKIMDLTLFTNPIPFMEKTIKQSLILSAEKEIVFPQNLLKLSASYLDNFHYTVVPNSSSFLTIDQPEICTQLMNEFLITGDQGRFSEDIITNEIYENIRVYTEGIYEKGTKTEKEVNTIQVDFLYSFQAIVNGKKIVHGWNQRYAKQLLIYLVFNQTATRDQICEHLWPYAPWGSLKKNLRVYLYHLKNLVNPYSFHEPVLVIERKNVYLNGDVSSDVLSLIFEIQKAVDENNEHTKYKLIYKIFNKLTTPGYLVGISDDWFIQLRNKIENDLIDLSIWMGKWLIENGEWQKARNQLRLINTIFDGDEEIDNILLELESRNYDNKCK